MEKLMIADHVVATLIQYYVKLCRLGAIHANVHGKQPVF
jgi:hypothetical protein